MNKTGKDFLKELEEFQKNKKRNKTGFHLFIKDIRNEFLDTKPDNALVDDLLYEFSKYDLNNMWKNLESNIKMIYEEKAKILNLNL